MTPSDRFIAQVRRRLAKAEPEVARAYLDSLRKLVDSMPTAEIERMISTRAVDRLLSEHFGDAELNRALSRFNASVQQTTADGVLTFARDVPGAIQAGIEGVFGVVNPRVVDTIRTISDKVMGRLRDDVRESVRGVIERGYVAGQGPRTTARELRSLIGLSPTELKQVDNFRAALRGEDGRNWRSYERRDRRLDPTIERATANGKGLTDAQVEKMATAYERRRLALSAEANARTATLNAYKAAQQASWQTAIDAGIIDGANLLKEWTTVGDSRVREEHAAMEGEVVPFDEPYSNGEMVPGEADWNCRCWSRMFVGAEDTRNPVPSTPEPIAAEGAWQASMTPAEADVWGASSVVRDVLEHVTSERAAAAIAEEGFEVTAGAKGFGDYWTRGVYLSEDRATTAFYKRAYTAKYGGSGEVLNTRVNVSRVLEVTASTHESVGPTAIIEAMGGDNGRVAILAARLREEEPGLNVTARYIRAAREVAAAMLREQGYDAVRVLDVSSGFQAGGNQLIVLDPKRVTVLK